MNKRIKEFEKQCWNNQTNHLDAEKFAELIVRECVSFVGDLNSQKAKEMLEHFGVEK